jgi:hypothetical protein
VMAATGAGPFGSESVMPGALNRVVFDR